MIALDEALALADEIEALGSAIEASLDDPARLFAHVDRRGACVQKLAAMMPPQVTLPPTALLRIACAVSRLDAQGRALTEALSARRDALAQKLTRLRQKRSLQGAYAARSTESARGAVEVRG